jgi:hypothetical protein
MYETKSTTTVNTYAYFQQSARLIADSQEIGSEPQGIILTSLTAFMMEAYLNHCCQYLYDYQARVNEFLDENPKNIIEILDATPKTDPFNTRIAVGTGYLEQYELLKEKLLSKFSKKSRGEPNKLFNPVEGGLNQFGDIDRRFRFSPSLKAKAVLLAIGENNESATKKINVIEKLFKARDRLAHGKTEKLSSNKVQEEASSNRDIEVDKSQWQIDCTPELSKARLHETIEIIISIHEQLFKSNTPFLSLSSQFASIAKVTR